MNESDENSVNISSRLVSFALFNACAQWLLYDVLIVFVFLDLSASRSPIIPVTRDDPLSPFISDLSLAPWFVSPVLSLSLIPAIRSRYWQVVGVIATLLNAGLMLVVALFMDTLMFLPMVGYIVSTLLVESVLLGRKS